MSKYIELSNEIPTSGIAVDCGSVNGKNPGIYEFRLVDIATKKVIKNYIVPGVTSNNISEWLALVEGLKLANKTETIVYSDSLTAISWARKKRCLTQIVITDKEQLKMIKDAEQWLKINGGNATKWRTHIWGEVPADYGNKTRKKK